VYHTRMRSNLQDFFDSFTAGILLFQDDKPPRFPILTVAYKLAQSGAVCYNTRMGQPR